MPPYASSRSSCSYIGWTCDPRGDYVGIGAAAYATRGGPIEHTTTIAGGTPLHEGMHHSSFISTDYLRLIRPPTSTEGTNHLHPVKTSSNPSPRSAKARQEMIPWIPTVMAAPPKGSGTYHEWEMNADTLLRYKSPGIVGWGRGPNARPLSSHLRYSRFVTKRAAPVPSKASHQRKESPMLFAGAARDDIGDDAGGVEPGAALRPPLLITIGPQCAGKTTLLRELSASARIGEPERGGTAVPTVTPVTDIAIDDHPAVSISRRGLEFMVRWCRGGLSRCSRALRRR